MTIEQITYYYCTKCDKEYPDIGSVYLRCVNDIHQEKEDGCESCMRQCFDPNHFKTKSHIKGCGRWFCNNTSCMETTKFFDNWYPTKLCKDCVTEYGLEKFYGNDHGETLWKEIEHWRFAEFGSKNKPIVKRVTDEGRVKRYTEGEIQQRIFQRYYIPIKKNNIAITKP